MKATVGFCINDSSYLHHIQAFYRQADITEQLILIALQQIPNEDVLNTFDLIIVEREIMNGNMGRITQIPYIVLEHKRHKKHCEESIEMYQPLDQLFQEVMSKLYPSVNHSNYHQQRRRQEIISVYSLSGGTGKTSVAIGVAKLFSERGKRALYLCLEDIASPISLESTEYHPDLSELIYVFEQEQLNHSFWHRCKHPLFDFYCIQAKPQFLEIQALNSTRWTTLLQTIQDDGYFDVVIIDHTNQLNDSVFAILHESHRIFWLLHDDRLQINKLEAFLAYCEWAHTINDWSWIRRSEYIVNRHTGHIISTSAVNSLSFSGVISFAPEWSSEKHILNTYSHEFMKSIAHIIDSSKEGMFYA